MRVGVAVRENSLSLCVCVFFSFNFPKMIKESFLDMNRKMVMDKNSEHRVGEVGF